VTARLFLILQSVDALGRLLEQGGVQVEAIAVPEVGEPVQLRNEISYVQRRKWRFERRATLDETFVYLYMCDTPPTVDWRALAWRVNLEERNRPPH
jgi:hypothetical protein